MDIDIVIPNRFYSVILNSGFKGKSESGAWLLFSRSSIPQDSWSKKTRRRFILHQIWPFTDNDIESASSAHLTMKTESLIPVMKIANTDFEVGFLHGHPGGLDQFSNTDDKNEIALLTAVQNRNGKKSKFISILALPNGNLYARCWHSIDEYQMCEITLTGSKIHKFGIESESTSNELVFDRQIRLFGKSFNKIFQELKVVVVGAGGTGAPLTIMLARAGVKKIVVIDPDKIDESNLHRLHGAKYEDIGKSKAETLASFINSIGLCQSTVGKFGNVLEPEFQNILKSADVIFCATDDHAGRMLLNRFAYYYETTVIDIGIASAKLPDGKIQDITGRVTILYPGTACLHCRGIIDTNRAKAEDVNRRSPELYNELAREGYILGGGEPEPAFISITTSVATMAVEELIELITKFRKSNFELSQRFRRFHIPEDRCTLIKPKSTCPICFSDENWGIGDVNPFLDRVP